MVPTPGFELDPAEFDRRLRTLDADAFEAFVADCWRARGWTVERTGEHLVVTHPERGDSRTLAVRAVPWWWPGVPSTVRDADVDLVVVDRPVAGSAGSVVDASALHEMVRYSLDPAARNDLFEEHLNGTETLPGRALRRVPPGPLRRHASVVLALAVLLVAGAAAAGVALLPGDQPASGPEDANVSVTPTDDRTARETPSAFEATRWPMGAGGFPPGLSSDGITDPGALASTHASRVAGRPSTLTLTVREFEAGQFVGTYRERVAVEDNSTFASSIERSGDVRGDHPTIVAVEMYANRNGAYVHAPDARTAGSQEILLASPGDATGVHHRVELFLADVLATDLSSVVGTRQIGDTTFHRVDGTRRLADGGVENVSAVVTAGGTVHSVRVERTVPAASPADGDGTVVVTLRYTFGPVTVDRPAWVGNGSVTIARSLATTGR